MNDKIIKKANEPHPLLKSLPDYLKDHNNYEKVKRAILDAGSTGHNHDEVSEWIKCTHCVDKQKDRVNMMRKLGFKSAAQYKAWDKVQSLIQENKIRNSITKNKN